MNKNELREQVRAKRRFMTAEEVAEKSEKIQSRLFAFDKYLNAKTVMLFMSAFKEPSTDNIIRDALLRGKKVVVPVSNTDTETIIPSYINGFDDLKKGAYGILEPKKIQPVDISEIDFFLVPGIVFDKNGNRIGFGKGYYDKILHQSNAEKCAVCYEFQIFDDIPSDKLDVRMNTIITEENIYAF